MHTTVCIYLISHKSVLLKSFFENIYNQDWWIYLCCSYIFFIIFTNYVLHLPRDSMHLGHNKVNLSYMCRTFCLHFSLFGDSCMPSYTEIPASWSTLWWRSSAQPFSPHFPLVNKFLIVIIVSSHDVTKRSHECFLYYLLGCSFMSSTMDYDYSINMMIIFSVQDIQSIRLQTDISKVSTIQRRTKRWQWRAFLSALLWGFSYSAFFCIYVFAWWQRFCPWVVIHLLISMS